MKKLFTGLLILASVTAFANGSNTTQDTSIELVDGGKISLVSRTGETVNVSCNTSAVSKKECVCVDGGLSIELTLKQGATKHTLAKFSYSSFEPDYSETGKGQALAKCERKIIDLPQCF